MFRARETAMVRRQEYPRKSVRKEKSIEANMEYLKANHMPDDSAVEPKTCTADINLRD